jgi:hypothetical protein
VLLIIELKFKYAVLWIVVMFRERRTHFMFSILLGNFNLVIWAWGGGGEKNIYKKG